MFTNENIIRYTNIHPTLKLNEKTLVNKPKVSKCKTNNFVPRQKDVLFWCFYIILNGKEKYLFNINNIFTIEKQTKIAAIEILKSSKIKNIKLPVSAPFHCKLMSKATEIMKFEIEKTNFKDSSIKLISNVTAAEISNKEELKNLLIRQIENRVRWRESVINMIDKGVNHFIEIGPGKVLSGLVKRINKDVKINTINSESDIKDLKI